MVTCFRSQGRVMKSCSIYPLYEVFSAEANVVAQQRPVCSYHNYLLLKLCDILDLPEAVISGECPVESVLDVTKSILFIFFLVILVILLIVVQLVILHF